MLGQKESGYKGFFISFEGGDWSGKTTQVKALVQALEKSGYRVWDTREPGGTNLGQQLRQLLMHGEDLDPYTEALLYAADRSHHVHTEILPRLQAGEIVITDRYIDSSVAYQGAARTLGAEAVADLSLWATGGLLPDLTFLLDGDPEVLKSRRENEEFDRIEMESFDFHYSVREEFLRLAQTESDRFRVLDATQSIEELSKEILTIVEAALA